MKRFISFDFIKGVAIIGVLGFHLLNVLYDYEAALKSNPPIPYYLIVIFFYYVGQFFGLFIILSGIGNVLSMKSQWDSISERTPENLLIEGNKIIKIQISRGLLTFLLGFITESLINGLIIMVITEEQDILNKFVRSLYLSNIIQMIGIGTIVGGIIYIKYLQKYSERIPLSKFLLIISSIFVVVNIILIETLPLIPGFDKYLGNAWRDRNFLQNVGFFLLFPLIGRVFPIFPNLLYIFIGVYLGDILSKRQLPPGFYRKIIYTSLLLTAIGVLFSFIEPRNDYYKNIFEIPLILNGILLAIFILFYLIDYRGKTKKFAAKTVLIRKFGLLTLTIWSLQWIMALGLRIAYEFEKFFGSETISFNQSEYMQGGFTGWEFWCIFIIFFIIYSLIIIGWSKYDYKYSLEWFVARALSKNKRDADKRLKMNESIYNVESLYETPDLNAKARYGYLTLLLFFAYAAIFVAIALL